MKKSDLDSLNALPYFTMESVKQLWGAAAEDDETVRTALYRWMKAGQVIHLEKGVYMSRRFYELHRGDAGFSPAISAILLPQSYLSLEFVLQQHAVLTEVTYPVSAVTTRNTRLIENILGTFSYRHIQSRLYTGFTLFEYFGILYAQASAAKALFDALYLRPWQDGMGSPSNNLAQELRLNLDDFSPGDWDEFGRYVSASQSPKMEHILENLRRTAWQP